MNITNKCGASCLQSLVAQSKTIINEWEAVVATKHSTYLVLNLFLNKYSAIFTCCDVEKHVQFTCHFTEWCSHRAYRSSKLIKHDDTVHTYVPLLVELTNLASKGSAKRSRRQHVQPYPLHTVGNSCNTIKTIDSTVLLFSGKLLWLDMNIQEAA